MTIIERLLFVLFAVCCVTLCLLAVMPAAQAASSSIIWAQPQAYYDSTHAVPDDDVWIDYPLLRSGDSSVSSGVTFSIVEATMSNGNNPGEYELLAANPIIFSPGSTYALIKVRYHRSNHNVFGTQHLTFRLSDSDAVIEPDQETRTVYVDYPAMPALAFASPPAGGYRGVEGQTEAIVLNVTKSEDAMVDAYADIFASGMATNGPDYSLADASGRPVSIPGTIHLPPGESVYPIYMTLLNDANVEGNETATFTLGNVRNAAIGNQTSVSVVISEAGTVTPVSPSGSPIPSPSASPAVTLVATAVKPAGNTTPVPLPSPGFGPEVVLIAILGIAICLKALRE